MDKNNEQHEITKKMEINNKNDSNQSNLLKNKKSKKKRCFHNECNKKIHLISYKCKYCGYDFCNSHVLPEIHKCKEINSIRCIEVNKLKKKLYSERTENDKIIKI